MAVRLSILNMVVNQREGLVTTEKVLANLVTQASEEQPEGVAPIPANVVNLAESAHRHVQEAKEALDAFYNAYIVPNS